MLKCAIKAIIKKILEHDANVDIQEFVHELVEPVTPIFNASLASGIVPAIWKDTNVTTIPKTQFPTTEGDLRPLSLTPCLPKGFRGLCGHVDD